MEKKWGRTAIDLKEYKITKIEAISLCLYMCSFIYMCVFVFVYVFIT